MPRPQMSPTPGSPSARSLWVCWRGAAADRYRDCDGPEAGAIRERKVFIGAGSAAGGGVVGRATTATAVREEARRGHDRIMRPLALREDLGARVRVALPHARPCPTRGSGRDRE